MQGDLISRSALIELLRNNTSNDIQDQIITENNINLIMSIPTAYDVEKVVAELDNLEVKHSYNPIRDEVMYKGIDIEEVKSIVRNGGKE